MLVSRVLLSSAPPRLMLCKPQLRPAASTTRPASSRRRGSVWCPRCTPEPRRSNNAIEGAKDVPFHRRKTEALRSSRSHVNAGGRRESGPNCHEVRNNDVHLVSGLLQDQGVPGLSPWPLQCHTQVASPSLSVISMQAIPRAPALPSVLWIERWLRRRPARTPPSWPA